jgi:hypothetical protein
LEEWGEREGERESSLLTIKREARKNADKVITF